MKRNFLSMVLAVAMMLPSATVSMAVQKDAQSDGSTAVIYMSPSGSNSNNGTKEFPVSTFNGVKRAINRLDKSVTDVVVEIGDGVYNITEGMVIDDALLKGRNLTMRAADGEKPVFSGSKSVDVSKFSPVTDKKMLERLHPNAAAYIGQIDLGELGFTLEQLDFLTGLDVGTSAFPVGVYLNDYKEKIARFPNSSYLRIENVIHGGGQRRYNTGGENDCGTFEVSQSNIRRWGNLKNAYVEGFLGVEYNAEWAEIGSVDTEKQRITMARWTQYGLKNAHKWAIINLPEEIDIPGEWYIDLENLIMYYYPRYPIDKENDSLEIAILKEPMITLQSIANVTIEGLTLKNSGANGIAINSCTDININNCKLYNLTGYGVHLTNATRNTVAGCEIYETGDIGIYLESGGDRNKLISNECLIKNNHIFRTGTDSAANWNGGIRLGANTVGTVVENNIIHGIKNYSYTFGGNENEFRYNEIWNGNRETADSGPVYCGRKLNEYGNKISYNYIHDCVNFTNNEFGNHMMGSGDDWQSGTILENNIIHVGKKSNTSGIGTHSRDNIIRYNITVEAGTGLALNDRYRYIPDILVSTNGTTQGLIDTLNGGDGLKKGFSGTAVWQSKYPQIATIYDDIVANNGRFMVRDNIITDNLNVDAPTSVQDDIFYEISTVERNLDIDDYDVFVDYKNHDFRITREAMKKYNLDEHIVNEDNFSMDEIGILEDEKSVEIPDGEFRKIYPRNGDKNLQREGLELVWERAVYADQYSYVVAKDAAMTDIVASGTTLENTVVLENLENSTSYYWTVTAENIGKQTSNTWGSVGEPYLFTTSKYDKLDKTILNSVIKDAEALVDTITEGENVDDYQKGTLENFQYEIEEAKKAAALTKGTSDMITNAVSRLRSYMNLIEGYKIKGYIGLSMDKDKWTGLNLESGEWSFGADEVSANAGSNSIIYGESIPNNRILRFNIKSEFNPWFGFGIKQKNPKAMAFSATDTSYCIIVKKDIFELQKYNPYADTTGIIKTAPNNGIIPENEWVDIELGAINVPGGVEIRLAVNGKVVFDYYDKNAPIHEMGYFTVIPSYRGGWTTVKTADSVPSDIYIPDESIFVQTAERKSTYFTTDDTFYSEDGTFSNVSAQGYESDTIRVSENGTAMWDTQVPMKDYRFYYWHTPLENGDKNAKVVFETIGGIAGSFKFEKDVDFSAGEAGWRDIGTFTPSSPDAQNGLVNIKIIGSGNGTIPVSAVRMDEAIEDEIDFSKLFYEQNKNLMVMKVGKDVYFNNIEKQIFDVTPEIVNGRTYVPLRSIAEGFGFTVDYNESERKITLTNENYTVVFTVNQNDFYVNNELKTSDAAPFIKNDRTLLPLRALAEAISKTVFWDDERELILIGDKVEITESNKSSYNNSLNMLSEWIDK